MKTRVIDKDTISTDILAYYLVKRVEEWMEIGGEYEYKAIEIFTHFFLEHIPCNGLVEISKHGRNIDYILKIKDNTGCMPEDLEPFLYYTLAALISLFEKHVNKEVAKELRVAFKLYNIGVEK